MKRWLVTDGDIQLKLYYNTIDECKKQYPSANIEEYNDMTYVKYINKIIELSYNTMKDYKGRTVYILKYNSGNLHVILYKDNIDNIWYDYCQYQYDSKTSYLNPITYTMSSPKELYDKFFNKDDIDRSRGVIRISVNDLKKIKPKVIKFYNKNNNSYWIDNEGYIYQAKKSFLPNKKSIEEYNVLSENRDNVILVNYTEPLEYGNHTRWFVSKDEFDKVFNKICEDTPTSYGSPRYEIKKVGYKLKHPNDRGLIFKLPYYNIDRIHGIAKDNTHNKNNTYNTMAREWSKMFDGSKYSENWFDNIDMCEDIIKKYMEYKEK